MSHTIRTLGPGDAALVEAMNDLFAEVFAEPETYTAKRPSRGYLEGLLGGEGFVAIVALDEGGSVVGGLAAYELRKFEQERSELYLYDLGVAEAHRRRGIATALIAEAVRVAAERGAWVVYVQADLDSPAAIALYGSLGTREEVLHFDIPVRRASQAP